MTSSLRRISDAGNRFPHGKYKEVPNSRYDTRDDYCNAVVLSMGDVYNAACFLNYGLFKHADMVWERNS